MPNFTTSFGLPNRMAKSQVTVHKDHKISHKLQFYKRCLVHQSSLTMKTSFTFFLDMVVTRTKKKKTEQKS